LSAPQGSLCGSSDRFLVGTKSKTPYFDFIPLVKHHRNCALYAFS